MFKKYVIACVLAGLAAAAAPMPVIAASVALPNSMAATGDSITRAFDVTGTCLLQDCPKLSWSSGSDPSVDSQYTRLLALNPAIAGHQYNIAKTGAKMADLPNQLVQAGYYKIDYVTVLMGANDLCTSSAATMTPSQTFVTQFYTALADYFYFNPGGHVFVSSIPDIFQLWTTLHTNSSATSTWSLFNVCQSMLAKANTDADRQKVVDQEKLDNYLLGYVCTTFFANCRWDNYATFNVKFPVTEVSKIDYFHPNVAGQTDLAGVTWAASYWAT
jgi:hypothetical protein